MFIIYVMDTSKIKCEEGGSYFYKNQKYWWLEKEYMNFFRKMLNVSSEHSIQEKYGKRKHRLWIEILKKLKKILTKQESAF